MASPQASTAEEEHSLAAAAAAAAAAGGAAAASPSPSPAVFLPPGQHPIPARIGRPVEAAYSRELRQKVKDLLDYKHDGFPGAQPVALIQEHLQDLEREDFYVCEKSDGLRYLMLLVYTPKGVPATFMIDRMNQCHFIDKLQFPLPSMPNQAPRWHNDTLLDGELVVDVDGPHKSLTFLVFDFMTNNGERHTQETYSRRLGIYQRDVQTPYEQHMKANPHLRMEVPFRVALKIQQRAYGLPRVFDEITKQKHGNDGLIFTSVNLPYVPGTCPKILKWKPPELITVDFQIKVEYDPDRKPHYSVSVAEGGAHKHYDRLTLEPALAMQWRTHRPDNRIGEFRWDPEWKTFLWEKGYVGTERRGGWRFVRFRDDKEQANDLAVVQDTIHAITHGVPKDMLLGWINTIRDHWKQRENGGLPPRHPNYRKFSASVVPSTPVSEIQPLLTGSSVAKDGFFGQQRRSSSGSSASEHAMLIEGRRASGDRQSLDQPTSMPASSVGFVAPESQSPSVSGPRRASFSHGGHEEGPDRRHSVGIRVRSPSLTNEVKEVVPQPTTPIPDDSPDGGMTMTTTGAADSGGEDLDSTPPSRKRSFTELMAQMPKGIRLKKPVVSPSEAPQDPMINQEVPAVSKTEAPGSGVTDECGSAKNDRSTPTTILPSQPGDNAERRNSETIAPSAAPAVIHDDRPSSPIDTRVFPSPAALAPDKVDPASTPVGPATTAQAGVLAERFVSSPQVGFSDPRVDSSNSGKMDTNADKRTSVAMEWARPEDATRRKSVQLDVRPSLGDNRPADPMDIDAPPSQDAHAADVEARLETLRSTDPDSPCQASPQSALVEDPVTAAAPSSAPEPMELSEPSASSLSEKTQVPVDDLPANGKPRKGSKVLKLPKVKGEAKASARSKEESSSLAGNADAPASKVASAKTSKPAIKGSSYGDLDDSVGSLEAIPSVPQPKARKTSTAKKGSGAASIDSTSSVKKPRSHKKKPSVETPIPDTSPQKNAIGITPSTWRPAPAGMDVVVPLPPPPIVLMTAPRPRLDDDDVYDEQESPQPSPRESREPRFAEIPVLPSRAHTPPPSAPSTAGSKTEPKKKAAPRKKAAKNSAAGVAGESRANSGHRRTASTPSGFQTLPLTGDPMLVDSPSGPGSRRPSAVNQRRGSLSSQAPPSLPPPGAYLHGESGYAMESNSSPRFGPPEPMLQHHARTGSIGGHPGLHSGHPTYVYGDPNVPMQQRPSSPGHHGPVPDGRRRSSVSSQVHIVPGPPGAIYHIGPPPGHPGSGVPVQTPQGLKILYSPVPGTVYVEGPPPAFYAYSPPGPQHPQQQHPHPHQHQQHQQPQHQSSPHPTGQHPSPSLDRESQYRYAQQQQYYQQHQQQQALPPFDQLQQQPSSRSLHQQHGRRTSEIPPQLQQESEPNVPPAPPTTPQNAPVAPTKAGKTSGPKTKAPKAPKVSKAATKRAAQEQLQQQLQQQQQQAQQQQPPVLAPRPIAMRGPPPEEAPSPPFASPHQHHHYHHAQQQHQQQQGGPPLPPSLGDGPLPHRASGFPPPSVMHPGGPHQFASPHPSELHAGRQTQSAGPPPPSLPLPPMSLPPSSSSSSSHRPPYPVPVLPPASSFGASHPQHPQQQLTGPPPILPPSLHQQQHPHHHHHHQQQQHQQQQQQQQQPHQQSPSHHPHDYPPPQPPLSHYAQQQQQQQQARHMQQSSQHYQQQHPSHHPGQQQQQSQHPSHQPDQQQQQSHQHRHHAGQGQ
ncbi:Dcp1p-Dcp2p decapping enzyme complex alpha subunit, partial [Thoreauomyces humboldtii]